MGVSAWMTGFKLKPNPSKVEFLLIGTKLQGGKILNNFPCLILGQDTSPSTSAKKSWCSIRQYPEFPKTHIPNM